MPMRPDSPTSSHALPKSVTQSAASVPKPRGANRSTKVAGKLKVLPEQPDVVTPDGVAEQPSEELMVTTGESEDRDGDNEEDAEDDTVEVGLSFPVF
jgi:hypothetical protein